MASDYVIKNFEDIETSGADGIDGRFSRKFLDSTELGVSRWRYEPGTQVPGHRHEVQEEVYTVINGSGRVKLDDEIIEIKQWDVIRVAPKVARGFEVGDADIEDRGAVVACAPAAPTGDPRPIAGRIAADEAVVTGLGNHRRSGSAGVELPFEQPAVEAAQPVRIPPCDLEMHDRV